MRGSTIGMMAMFLLLSLVFRSYLEPIVVMTTVPLSLIGVAWGHLPMGLASLSGVVVNNAILLVAFIKLHHGRGTAIPEAAMQPSRDRLRPVVLTTLTTVAGLTPLLFETSAQAQLLITLVASLAFGIFTAAVLVLVFVPALYTIIDDLGPATIAGKEAAEARRDERLFRCRTGCRNSTSDRFPPTFSGAAARAACFTSGAAL